MVGATNRRLEVGNEGIDPVKDMQVARLAWADDDRAVLGHNRPGRGKARQTVGDQVNALVQRLACAVCHGRPLQILDRVEAYVLRIPLLVELHGGDERHLVLRSSPRLAGVSAAKVGVVGHHQPNKLAERVALGHGFKQLMLDPSGGAVTHAQMALERERRDVVLVLCDQIDRMEPFGQRQLGL